jgi:nucleoside-diphosphate-sugar epimerase
MAIPVNPEAVELFRSSLPSRGRVLILGASGWFGRTALALLGERATDCLLIASNTRVIEAGDFSYSVRAWDEGLVEEFEPTVVLDFAFLTKDSIPRLGIRDYEGQLDVLGQRLFRIAEMPSVERILTVSSGAARYHLEAPENDPYGDKKRETEIHLRGLAQRGLQVSVARAWSVSGGFVTKPHNYAFSDFVLNALATGVIEVESRQKVYRRYCAVEDLLALTLAHNSTDAFYDLDSGGELVELGELATEVTSCVAESQVRFVHPSRDDEGASRYHSTGDQWEHLVRTLRYPALSLERQIENIVLAFSR